MRMVFKGPLKSSSDICQHRRKQTYSIIKSGQDETRRGRCRHVARNLSYEGLGAEPPDTRRAERFLQFFSINNAF